MSKKTIPAGNEPASETEIDFVTDQDGNPETESVQSDVATAANAQDDSTYTSTPESEELASFGNYPGNGSSSSDEDRDAGAASDENLPDSSILSAIDQANGIDRAPRNPIAHPPSTDESGINPAVVATAPTSSTPADGARATSPPDLARGKFSPEPKSFKTMTIPELRNKIEELKARVGKHGMSFNRYRRALGQALDEMRRRIADAGGRLVIQKGEPAVNWDEYCTSIGLNRRSASSWADNWRTIRDSPSNLLAAAELADIDLYQPRTAKILRLINEELEGKVPSETEIPALLDRLDPPDEPKPDGVMSPKRKNGNNRRNPKAVPVLTAPQPAPTNTVLELLNIWVDFFKRHPEVAVKDFLREYAMSIPKSMRYDTLISISDDAIALAELIASEEGSSQPADSMPAPASASTAVSPVTQTTAKMPPMPERNPLYHSQDVTGSFRKIGTPQLVEIVDEPEDENFSLESIHASDQPSEAANL
jgi:hypothetical protein